MRTTRSAAGLAANDAIVQQVYSRSRQSRHGLAPFFNHQPVKDHVDGVSDSDQGHHVVEMPLNQVIGGR
jgi:hypothetical protein